jgi:hypothetical protein
MNNHKILYSYYKKYNSKGGWRNYKGIEIPTIREDMVVIKSPEQTSGERSDEIVTVINRYYEKYNKNLSIMGTLKPSHLFNIKKIQKNSVRDPVWNQGASSAVYLIDDVNHIIDDNSELILKLFPQEISTDSNGNMIISRQMMDEPKVKKEYNDYGKYLPKIYFYGILNEVNSNYNESFLSTLSSLFSRTTHQPKFIPIPTDANQTNVNYIITKKYNSLPDSYEEFSEKYNLSNLLKLKFLISNINMLNLLYNNNLFHGDYKPANVGWENNDTMNVILLDYEKGTIISTTDSTTNYLYFKKTKYDTIRPNIDYFIFSPYYVPVYTTKGDQWITTKISEYDKWSIGGLAALIFYLNIEYNTSDVINFPPTISRLTLNPNIKTENVARESNFLHLYSDKYEDVPSYDELGRIFNHILDNKLYTE